MRQIEFQFIGGGMDGCRVEGDGLTSHSSVDVIPVLHRWLDTNFGTPGTQICMRADDSTPPQDDLYEVVDRIDGDGQVVVHAKHIPDPRD